MQLSLTALLAAGARRGWDLDRKIKGDGAIMESGSEESPRRN
jgi:hypothetical protein